MASKPARGWQANEKAHLCAASSIRAMPETEKPPAMRVDIYCADYEGKNGDFRKQRVCSGRYIAEKSDTLLESFDNRTLIMKLSVINTTKCRYDDEESNNDSALPIEEVVKMALTLDSTLKELMDNQEAVAILEKYSPGFTKNPMLKMGMGMKLTMCVKFPQAKMSEEHIKAFEEELKALG